MPSQSGLFSDLPQRHRVTLFLTSYTLPSEDSTGTHPFTQSGPLTFFWGSSTRLIEGLCGGSMDLPVFLSTATSLPAGQSHASFIAVFLAFGSDDLFVSSHVPPSLSQKRATAQRSSASSRSTPGPDIFFARFKKGSRPAVSVPSKPAAECVPSQYGAAFDLPHRHSIYLLLSG